VQELDPENVPNLHLLGNLYQSLEDIPNAVKTFERATQIDKNNWISRLNLSLMYRDMGRTSEAAEQRTLCIKLHPEAEEMFSQFDKADQEIPEQKKTDELDDGEEEQAEEEEEEADPTEDFLGLNE
jgi:tetratricopeptide (TPR) repeat protein